MQRENNMPKNSSFSLFKFQNKENTITVENFMAVTSNLINELR